MKIGVYENKTAWLAPAAQMIRACAIGLGAGTQVLTIPKWPARPVRTSPVAV